MRERKGIYRDWIWVHGIRGRIFKEEGRAIWDAEFYPEVNDRRRLSTRTSDEAQAWANLAKLCAEAAIRTDHEPFTLADAAASAGRAQSLKGVSEGWRERCIGIIEDHLFPIIGADFDLNGAGVAKAIEDYIAARRKMLTPSGKFTTYANIRKELLIIYQGCRRARDHGEFTGALAHILPDWFLTLYKIEKETNGVGLAVTEIQYLELLRVATLWRRPWIVFGRNTGIDIGPTHRIRKDEVLWDEGEYGAVPVWTDTKNRYRPRTVQLNHDARVAVDIRMQEPGEFLFEPMWSSQAFKECMKRWCPPAGIPKRIRWKDLARHTFISELGNHGAHKNHVTALVGQSGSSMMVEKVYQHLSSDALSDTVNLIPPMFGPSKVRQHHPAPGEKTQEKPGTPKVAECKKTLEKAV